MYQRTNLVSIKKITKGSYIHSLEVGKRLRENEIDLHMVFIDLENAYCMIPGEVNLTRFR